MEQAQFFVPEGLVFSFYRWAVELMTILDNLSGFSNNAGLAGRYWHSFIYALSKRVWLNFLL